MNMEYKKVAVTHEDSSEPPQIYITEEWVDAERIRQGHDEGVLCYCITEQAADLILEAMNGGKA